MRRKVKLHPADFRWKPCDKFLHSLPSDDELKKKFKSYNDTFSVIERIIEKLDGSEPTIEVESVRGMTESSFIEAVKDIWLQVDGRSSWGMFKKKMERNRRLCQRSR
jgi:hypothetical protein